MSAALFRFSIHVTKKTILPILGIVISGCSSNGAPGILQARDLSVHTPIQISSSDTPPEGTYSPTSPSGPSEKGVTGCSNKDNNSLCIGLKYVVYQDNQNEPIVSKATALGNVSSITKIWSQCQIEFQLDEFVAADPTSYGLNLNTANDSELDQIRKAFDDNSHFLVVTTGTWDRSGTLGNTGANAWTNMPGDGVYGAILELPVGTYANIIAHELGHYMNLDHVSDTADLMNPVIYDYSNQLTADQCKNARSAVTAYWQKMLR